MHETIEISRLANEENEQLSSVLLFYSKLNCWVKNGRNCNGIVRLAAGRNHHMGSDTDSF